jgi:large subunit ribosomal protein L3
LKRALKKKVGIVGRKVGMTQIFSDRGEQVPVTVIKAGPCLVVAKRVAATDGYEAVQIGFEEVTRKKGVNRPRAGTFKKAGVPPQRSISEVRDMDPEAYEVGQALKADLFQVGELVVVQGISKGRGFAGGVKRHGYAGGKASHGSMFHRAPGSIGAAAWPSRVFKGKRLPGHMGNEKVSVKNLTVMGVDPEKDLILVKGAVPGPISGMVLITAERE